MATLGDMRTRIARELQIDASGMSAEIDAAIFSAIEFYNDYDFWFLEATPVLFVGTLTNEFDLSTVLPDMSSIKTAVVHLGSRRLNMHYRTHQELLDLDIDDNYAGDPVYWTVRAGKFIVEPRLRQSRTIELHYSNKTTLTASASAESVWTNEAEELIRMHAEADILENRIKDYQGADRARIREMFTLENLQDKTVRRNSFGRIRPYL